MKKLALVLVLSNLLVVGSICQAVIIMDATHHNGAFTYGPAGYAAGQWSSPISLPTGWELKAGSIYTTATAGVCRVQVGTNAEGVNNTGEIVHAGQAFTVQADLGSGGTDTDATVRVWATQNIDGTGARIELANVHRPNGLTPLVTVVGTEGAPADASIEGYYVQVAIGGPYVDHYILGYYDNIVVTATPEPATLALLGLGGLFLRKRK